MCFGSPTHWACAWKNVDVELGLEKVIPAEFMLHAHHWLILHGRYTCLARKPRCEVCLINDLCRWPKKTV
jgi:endonuclease-3